MGSLRDRLQRLQKPAESAASPSLRERVDQRRARPEQKQHFENDASLTDLLEADEVAPGLLCVEKRWPLNTKHGRIALEPLLTPSTLPEAAGAATTDLLFLDTETSGLSGGTGTFAFLVGVARVEKVDLVIRQYLLTRFSAELFLFEALSPWFAEAGAVVTYNGKAFDMPLLTARMRLNGQGNPLVDKPHWDLLHPVRRAFASRWDDCRLITVERRLLRFEREDDLPGALVPAAWFAYVHQGDATSLPSVMRHNFLDLVSLAALLPAIDAVHREPGAWEADVLAIARHLARRDEPAGFRLLEEHTSMLDLSGLRELARAYRRRSRWQEACAIWSTLAAEGCRESIEFLAKYHEHVARDPEAALRYAERLPQDGAAMQRRRRLLGKLGATPDL